MPVIYDESMDQYHANEAVGSGDLRAFMKSPRLYMDNRLGIGGKKESAALSLGTLAHMFFLEPDRYAREVVVKPEGHDGRTKEGKAWNEANAGRMVISVADQQVLDILKVRMPEAVKGILLPFGGAKAEVTYRAELDGVMCQCRADWQVPEYSEETMHIYDLKTCQNVDDAAKSVWDWGYHIQQEFYRLVYRAATKTKLPRFTFIFCETQAPYRWRVITLDDTLARHAQEKIGYALAGIKHCIESDDWSDNSPTHQTVSAPKWAGLTESEQ